MDITPIAVERALGVNPDAVGAAAGLLAAVLIFVWLFLELSEPPPQPPDDTTGYGW